MVIKGPFMQNYTNMCRMVTEGFIQMYGNRQFLCTCSVTTAVYMQELDDWEFLYQCMVACDVTNPSFYENESGVE